MASRRKSEVSDEIHKLLGDDAFFALVQNYGGLRLYIPSDPERSELTEKIGAEATAKLSEEFPGLYCKVPLAREFRVLRFRKDGMSNREIAVRLCLTESGVDRIIAKARKATPHLVAPSKPREKAPPKPKVKVEKKPRKAPDPRTVAIKAYFLEHVLTAGRDRPQRKIADAFNQAHKGQYYLTPSSASHWFRWAMEEQKRRSGVGGILSKRQ